MEPPFHSYFNEFEKLSLEIETSQGRALLMADPHLGFELSRGMRLRTGLERTLADFIVEKNPDVLVLLGDVKEPIGLSYAMKSILREFFSRIEGIPTIITRGNHDGRIDEAVEGFAEVEVVDSYTLDGNLFLHGHTKLPEGEFGEVFLGHIHPAYTLKSGGTSRKIKVFARAGKFLILPTVNPFLEGFDVREGVKMVPFLRCVGEVDVFLPDGIHLGRLDVWGSQNCPMNEQSL